MNLRQIEVFRAVMIAGSVTGAARLLHVSQPGISRMLAHIELQTGVRLFERGKGRLSPTPEAAALYAEVERIYRGVARIDDVARSLQSGLRLELRVLASPSTALEVVPRAVTEVAARFPAASFYVETALVREIVDRLAHNEAHVAISTLPIAHALMTSRVVGRWSLACVFPVGHPFGARRSIGLRDIVSERFIAFSPDTPQGQLVHDWLRRQEPRYRPQIEVRAGALACALVASGAGIAVVDDLTAHGWRRESLEFRPVRGAPSFDVFAVHHQDMPMSAPAKALVERVAAALRSRRVSSGQPAKA
jgi:DNA-binding transcriptional LysR family regulator